MGPKTPTGTSKNTHENKNVLFSTCLSQVFCHDYNKLNHKLLLLLPRSQSPDILPTTRQGHTQESYPRASHYPCKSRSDAQYTEAAAYRCPHLYTCLEVWSAQEIKNSLETEREERFPLPSMVITPSTSTTAQMPAPETVVPRRN